MISELTRKRGEQESKYKYSEASRNFKNSVYYHNKNPPINISRLKVLIGPTLEKKIMSSNFRDHAGFPGDEG